MSAADFSVDVQVAWEEPDTPTEEVVQSWVKLAVEASQRAPTGSAEVAVRIVGADEIRALNKRYRNQDKSTNVLSFPVGDIDGMPDAAERLLGDIVICAPVVRAEAKQQGRSLKDHWAHMLVHGTLHLLGFDHQTETDAIAMERLESEILARRGITNPYPSR